MKLNELRSDIQTYTLTAVIDSALCIGSGGSSGSLADKPIVRNAENRLIIPGSHLKGRLRHECEKLARGLGLTVSESPNPGLMMQTQGCMISAIFGKPDSDSRLLVDDLICDSSAQELPTEVIRPGVTINRSRGTAEDDKLYWLETSPANQKLKFTGQLHLELNSEIDYALPLLVAGLKHINALGGSKSAGLGWLTWEKFPAALTIDRDHVGWTTLRGGQT
jgi:CRISPR/Cas system CSM-associated protein Csm3 (group 7 of RAMP superfamily)